MRVSEMEVITPASVPECLSYLSNTKNKVRLIAGGTDAVVQMKEGIGRPEVWMNIKHMRELRFIREEEGGIRIGALSTHSDIFRSPVLKGKADALMQACGEVGAEQIRNMGTIGGNIATASPAGDTLPALYLYDTEIELQSLSGTRRVKIEEFFHGPRRTECREQELITSILIRPQKPGEISIFQKLGLRGAQAISIINVAVKLAMGSQPRQCLGVIIAFGSVGPTVLRAKKCEAMLTCAPVTDDLIYDIGKMAWKEVAPITDIRATAEYRRDMAGALLQRGLYRLMKRWDEQ